MDMQAIEIESLLKETFPDAKIVITDLAGDGNQYAAEDTDECFRGKYRVQQQRAVNAALKVNMDCSNLVLHELALTKKVAN